MAGILVTISNLSKLIGALYPLFIVSFLLLASVFNLKLTGLVYLGGITVTIILCYLFGMMNIIEERSPNAALSCDLFSMASHPYKGPSTQAAISWFTFAYLLWPMLPPMHPGGLLNPIIFVVTLIFAIINSIFQYRNECANTSGIILGAVIGLLAGTGWFWTWYASGHKDLLFYNELVSNNAICTRPSRQTFKCEVWKGGELISSSTV